MHICLQSQFSYRPFLWFSTCGRRSTGSKQTLKGLFICLYHFWLFQARVMVFFNQSCFLDACASFWQMICFLRSERNKSVLMSLRFDFNVNTTWKVEFAKRIYCPAAAGVNVKQTLVGIQLKLLARFLIYVGRAQNCKNLFVRRQRNWTCNHSTRATYGFYNFLSRFINQIVVVRLQFDSNSLRHISKTLYNLGVQK